ncbi:MAG TPA: crosslink repair DNA glycosylase YcaQ family protein [Anaerolineae bacterium]|nr:crosslink repair DNA glycosylase YcaQ family protein [Anaerolineae bacterium]
MTQQAALKLSLETARTLAIVKQGLQQRPPIADKQALLESIVRIGLLQLDTINVVARSHYLVMLSRMGLYDPADLDALLHPDRCLFEQWAHAACLIPIRDYDYFLPGILARRERPPRHWIERRLGDDPQGTLDAVLAEVRERGPLASRDFEDPRGQRGTWWDWKPAKTALEILFAQGYLMVDRRENFQRYYDLAERVLPAAAEPSTYTMGDYQRWAVLRGVDHLGVASAAQASDYYRLKKPVVRRLLATLVEEGAVVPVDVEGWREPAYLRPADLSLVDEIEAGAHQPELTTFLSPFDNLVWDRERVRDLFQFDYRAEMYTSAAQRQYGYYVLPILHRGRLVGRLDPKADRKSNTLIVRAIYLEPRQPVDDELLAGISEAVREFMAFHGSDRLQIEHSEPAALGSRVRLEALRRLPA